MAPINSISRKDFHIAIICALPLEFDAVDALFDEHYDEILSNTGLPGDPNWYLRGRIGVHNVIMICLSHKGRASAASAVSSMLVSFRELELALVVGACGALPILEDGREIILGDVIISDSLYDYSLGRQYPDGFQATDGVQDLSWPLKRFVSELKTLNQLGELQKDLTENILQLQGKNSQYIDRSYPGVEKDILFDVHCRHKHYDHTRCICVHCQSSFDPVCGASLISDCSDIGCQGPGVRRQRLLLVSEEKDSKKLGPKPLIHFGTVASGDALMKSGEHRNELAFVNNAIGFEMEGAGVWGTLPCLIIKGVSDYADSHKNKSWQPYAAATAAACAKAVLAYFPGPGG
ncbi:nucleoside phosphorylase domain-containing protein [Aspergillus varians]